MPDPTGTPPVLSVQLYSVQHAFAADPAGTLARLAELGFRAVEAGDALRLDELAPVLRELGLATPTVHHDFTGQDLDAVFAAAARHGVGTVVNNALAEGAWKVPVPELWTSTDGIARLAEGLNAAAGRAAAHGVRIGYHHHHWEAVPQFDGRCGLEVLAAELDPAVALQMDLYWAAVGHPDPVGLVARLADRVRFAHVKDGAVRPDFTGQTPVGRGRAPVVEMLRAARHLEVAAVEFDAYDGDLFEALAQSRTYLLSTKTVTA